MASSLSGNVLTGDDSEKEQKLNNIDKMTQQDVKDLLAKGKTLFDIIRNDKNANYTALFFLVVQVLDEFAKADLTVDNIDNYRNNIKDAITQPEAQKNYKENIDKLVNTEDFKDNDPDLSNFMQAMQPFFFRQGGSGRKVMSGSGKPKHNLRKVNKVYHQLGYSHPKYQTY